MGKMQLKDIQTCIYRIRGQQVMLDSDLAALYGIQTRVLNQAVKRHLDRFPLDFAFGLSRHEILRISQSVTSFGEQVHLKFSKRITVFTEEGVAMLSGVLQSSRAVEVNIAIMRAFVRLRHAVLASRDVARRVEKLEGEVYLQKTDIRLIQEDMRQLKKRSITKEPIPPTII